MGSASEELRQILEKMKRDLLPEVPSSRPAVKIIREAREQRLPAATEQADRESEKQKLIAKYESTLRNKEAEHEKEIRILRGEFEQERRLLWGEIDALEMRTQSGEKRNSDDS